MLDSNTPVKTVAGSGVDHLVESQPADTGRVKRRQLLIRDELGSDCYPDYFPFASAQRIAKGAVIGSVGCGLYQHTSGHTHLCQHRQIALERSKRRRITRPGHKGKKIVGTEYVRVRIARFW